MVTNFFNRFYKSYSSTISLNKNLLLSGTVGFIVSLVVAYVSTKYSTDNFANSALTVITGFVFSKVVFVILFHLDNRKKYTKRKSGKLNLPVLKIVTKMIFADSIYDIISNVTRFFILLEFLRIEYPAGTSRNNSIHHSVLFLIFGHKFNCKTSTCIWLKEKNIRTKIILYSKTIITTSTLVVFLTDYCGVTFTWEGFR